MTTFIRALALAATTAGLAGGAQSAILTFDSLANNAGISISGGLIDTPFQGSDGNFLANDDKASPIPPIVMTVDVAQFDYDLLSFKYLIRLNPITYTVTDVADKSVQFDLQPLTIDWAWGTATADLSSLGKIKSVQFYSSKYFGLDTMEFSLSSTNNNVPEPASLALVGLALAGVAASRRRAKA